MPDVTPSMASVLKIAAAVVSDLDGRLLLVRKQGTAFFMQPGGKIDLGETALAALCRELKEELGLHVTVRPAASFGAYRRPRRRMSLA